MHEVSSTAASVEKGLARLVRRLQILRHPLTTTTTTDSAELYGQAPTLFSRLHTSSFKLREAARLVVTIAAGARSATLRYESALPPIRLYRAVPPARATVARGGGRGRWSARDATGRRRTRTAGTVAGHVAGVSETSGILAGVLAIAEPVAGNLAGHEGRPHTVRHAQRLAVVDRRALPGTASPPPAPRGLELNLTALDEPSDSGAYAGSCMRASAESRWRELDRSAIVNPGGTPITMPNSVHAFVLAWALAGVAFAFRDPDKRGAQRCQIITGPTWCRLSNLTPVARTRARNGTRTRRIDERQCTDWDEWDKRRAGAGARLGRGLVWQEGLEAEPQISGGTCGGLVSSSEQWVFALVLRNICGCSAMAGQRRWGGDRAARSNLTMKLGSFDILFALRWVVSLRGRLVVVGALAGMDRPMPVTTIEAPEEGSDVEKVIW
ncbi:hypothetical protein B0H15DRAFT_803365 [Mycena belliarum]|uniref:Uncharacterized protein n=1 Tax=Mycena belliarum TaxID=1033014 RepID=A0AAD6TYT4_9AGAR|nr:hypothetical protein B0H15DRAFT_803365 [Mycena belliae]